MVRRKKNGKSPALQVNKLGLVELNVAHMGISNLPTDIFNFSRVESIDASENCISNLPSILGNLKKLQVLDVHKNSLSQVPDAIGNCERLKYVDFSDNCLTCLPASIQNLKNLKYLRLAGNWFRFLNEEMMWIKSLEFLDISRNQLQVIPYGMQQLLQIQVLDLSQNNITTLPSHICKLRHLKSFNMRGNQLTGLPAQISNWTRLTELNLSHNRFTAIPEQLYDLSTLVYLDLGNNMIREVAGRLQRLTNIETLHLENNKLTTLNYLPPLTSYLNCSHNELHIVSVQGLHNLHHIDCCFNCLEYIPLGLTECPKIESILLSNNRVKEIPVEISRLRNLKILNLENNDLERVPSAINEIRQLQMFNIQGNKFNSPTQGAKAVKQKDKYKRINIEGSSASKWLNRENKSPEPKLTIPDAREQSYVDAFSPKHSSNSDLQNDLYKSRSMTDLRTSPAPNYKVIRSFSPPPLPTQPSAAAPSLTMVIDEPRDSTDYTQRPKKLNHPVFPTKTRPKRGFARQANKVSGQMNYVPEQHHIPRENTSNRESVAYTQYQASHLEITTMPQTTLDDLIDEIDVESHYSYLTSNRTDTYTVTPIGGRYTSSLIPDVTVEFPPGALDRTYTFTLQVEVYPQRTLERLKQVVSNELLKNLIVISPIVYVNSNDYLLSFRKAVTVSLPLSKPETAGYLHAISYCKDNSCDRPPGPYQKDGDGVKVSVTYFHRGIGAVITREKSTTQAIESMEEFLKLIYL